ncbi:MAG: hypothetical protein WCN98_03245 [Verrucomicrobiaceae bacterium]
MSRTTAASLLLQDEPILKFEESNSYPQNHSNTAFAGSSSSDEDAYGSLKRKQEELLKLRQKLERTERETNQLETQRRKEERFATGRREMTEKLSRALVRLERELYNNQKAVEEIASARDLYQRHLDVLQAVHPEAWQRANLDAELERAIGAIEDSEDVFGKTSRRLASVLPGEADALEAESRSAFPTDFKSWLIFGFAFTLPLAVIILIALIAPKFFH